MIVFGSKLSVDNLQYIDIDIDNLQYIQNMLLTISGQNSFHYNLYQKRKETKNIAFFYLRLWFWFENENICFKTLYQMLPSSKSLCKLLFDQVLWHWQRWKQGFGHEAILGWRKGFTVIKIMHKIINHHHRHYPDIGWL